MPTKTRSMFDLLDDVVAGDVLRLRFNNSAEVGDADYLLGMIREGILESPDPMTLMAITESRSWWGISRQFTVLITETFDRAWFEGRMSHRLDLLEVVERKTPLVEIDELETAIGVFRLRLTPEGFDAIPALLDLDGMQVIEIIDSADRERLGDAYQSRRWSGEGYRTFRIISRLTAEEGEYRLYFREHVLPHLELLRPY